MTCSNCEALRIENARLRREVLVIREAGDVHLVMVRFDVTATQARLLLRLYQAEGRPLTAEALADAISYNSRPAIKTIVSVMRPKLGPNVIETVQLVGYRLTVEGMSRMMAALEPVEMQDARCV